jgi:hypothetical protein
MYNTDMPSRRELPSSAQLIRSTIIAAIVALVLLVTVVMPSEYALDPTGAGRLLGLTEMGEVKEQLAQEALADKAMQMMVVQPSISKAASEPEWQDEVRFVLTPGEGTEYKLTMQEGAVARFEWISEGGPVNFDAHGDDGGQFISYKKGRNVPQDGGELKAAFTGNHGWFFRNRNDNDVTLVLRTEGDYGELKKAM